MFLNPELPRYANGSLFKHFLLYCAISTKHFLYLILILSEKRRGRPRAVRTAASRKRIRSETPEGTTDLTSGEDEHMEEEEPDNSSPLRGELGFYH